MKNQNSHLNIPKDLSKPAVLESTMTNSLNEIKIKYKINKSKSKKAKDNSSYVSDEKIDQIMKDITLKKPRNPYTQFVLNEVDQYKTKNKDAKIDIQAFSTTCAEKWKKMKDNDKKKYIKLYADEKVKYKADIELVRHYLFKDINDTYRTAPTAYRIFVNEKLREGFDKGHKIKIRSQTRRKYNKSFT